MSPRTWRGAAAWLLRLEHSGGPALLYVTSAVTTLVVLAITVLAVVEEAWMAGLAFLVLVVAVAALTAFIGVMLTDTGG